MRKKQCENTTPDVTLATESLVLAVESTHQYKCSEVVDISSQSHHDK